MPDIYLPDAIYKFLGAGGDEERWSDIHEALASGTDLKTVFDLLGLGAGNPFTGVLNGLVNVKDDDYGATGDGTTDDRAALALADAVGGPTYFPPGTFLVGSNLTLGAHNTFAPGAKLKPANGVTITLTAPLSAPDAQVFDISAGGTIAFGIKHRKAKPEWWGALGDDTGDDSAEIQAAVNAFHVNGTGTVEIERTYRITSQITGRNRVHLVGSGAIHQATKTAAAVNLSSVNDARLRGFTATHETAGVYDTASTVPLIYSTAASSNISLIELEVRDADKQGISAEDATDWWVTRCRFENIGRGAAVFTGGTRISVIDNQFDSTGDDCVAFNEASTGCIAGYNKVRNAGTLLNQGAGFKAHGQGNSFIANVVDGCISAAFYMKEDNGGTSEPQDNIIAYNQVLSMSDPSSGTPTQAAIRVDEIHGTVVVAFNTPVKAFSGTKNYPALKAESGTTSAYFKVDHNDFRHDPTLTASALVRFDDTDFYRIHWESNQCRCSEADCFTIDTNNLGGKIHMVGPNHFRLTDGHNVISQSVASAGIAELKIWGAILDNHTVPMLDLGNAPVTVLNLGDIDAEAGGLLDRITGVGTIKGRFTGTLANHNFPSVAVGDISAEATIEVEGARSGMTCQVTTNEVLPAGVTIESRISAANEVKAWIEVHPDAAGAFDGAATADLYAVTEAA